MSKERIVVIENWIDSDAFSPADVSAGRLPPRVSASEIRVLFVGGLQPLKGVQVLLESIAVLRRADIDVRLDIVGRGPEEARLKQLVDDLDLSGVAEFSGWVPNMLVPEKLRACDIFVLPSYQEGMPNAVLQAMSCGLPVIASAISSIPALVENGVNGFLVPPGDVDALASAIGKLAHDPALRVRMGVENRRKVLMRHTISLVWPRVAVALGVEIPI